MKFYLVKMRPIFIGSQLSCLARYQKILWGCSFGCKNLLNFNCHTMKFGDCHYPNGNPHCQKSPNNHPDNMYTPGLGRIYPYCTQRCIFLALETRQGLPSYDKNQRISPHSNQKLYSIGVACLSVRLAARVWITSLNEINLEWLKGSVDLYSIVISPSLTSRSFDWWLCWRPI